MNEQSLLRDVLPSLPQGDDIVVGPGDDCAVLDLGTESLFLMAVDQILADVHYIAEKTSPERIAKKLLNRNISDIAAMGGRPAHALLTLATENYSHDWYCRFFDALGKCAKEYGISVCGGDLATLKSGGCLGTLTITGWVKKENVCLRKNGRVGELLFVTGRLGNSFLSEHHLDFTPRVEEGEFLAESYTDCMMDISDGLLIDLQRLAIASDVGFELNLERLPLRDGATIEMGLNDGEDYELLFTVPQEKVEALYQNWRFDTSLTCIGKAIFQCGEIIDVKTKEPFLELLHSGYDHFESTI